MLTVRVKTETGTETWQATERDDGWYIRKGPDLQWSKEPFASSDANRKDVAQLLRKEKDVRY